MTAQELSPDANWPAQIAAIYTKYAAIAGEEAMDYGRAHIVWADDNFDDISIAYCLGIACPGHIDPQQDQAVIASLKELLAVPDEVRDFGQFR